MTLVTRRKDRPRPVKPWEGGGIDTETFRGWARLISTEMSEIWLRRGEWKRALRFVAAEDRRLAAWNLRFDAEAILKHLPENALRRLLAIEHLNIGEFSIDIVPWKLLRVKSSFGSTEIFDMAPFFGTSLRKAMETYLGADERKGDLDAARLNTDPRAWRARKRILTYCRGDARGAMRLAQEASLRYNQLGASFHRPFSPAFVAADLLLRESYVPKLPPGMVRPAESAFHGGRFECVQRGLAKRGYAYDVNAAYPSILCDIPDANGRWVSSRRPRKDALYAIVRAVADVPPDDYPILAPLPLKRNGRPTIYPTGRFETYVLLDTWNRFSHLLTPSKTWNYIPRDEPTFPFRGPVEKLWEFRKAGDALLGKSGKRAANSIYGKLLNQFEDKILRPIDGKDDHLLREIVMVDGEPHVVHRTKRPGMLYNPLLAGMVTEGIRLAVWDAAMTRPEAVLGFQADGILTDRKLPIRLGKGLGDWSLKGSGRTVMAGSGLYEIEGNATRFRGLHLESIRIDSWFNALRDLDEPFLTVVNNRPVHASEALRGATVATEKGKVKLRVSDVNTWVPMIRKVNVLTDDKREWDVNGSVGSDLLSQRFRSDPINVRLA